MPQERKERSIVGFTQDSLFLVPGDMTDNSDPDTEEIDLNNVFTGLQWYQAHKNEVGPLTLDQRVDILLEIFREPNDLLGLARTVELQTGTEGLIESVLKSHEWADWTIMPQIANVTEAISTNRHINVSLSIGRNIRVLSWHTFINDTETGLVEVESGRNVNPENLHIKSQFQISRYGMPLASFEDKHQMLPEFTLRRVEVLSDKRIRFEGDDLEDDYENTFEGGPERGYYSYIVTSRGSIEFDRQIREDPKLKLRRLVNELTEPLVISRDEVQEIIGKFNWHELRRMIEEDLEAKKALAMFLLPYCDMPTTDGHTYVMSEDSVLPDGRMAKDHFDPTLVYMGEE